MPSTLLLVRHGEVHNPDGVVYADLPGFGLSALGRAQAREAARHVAESRPVAIVSSPLERARETADAIAAATGVPVATDPRLTEWGLGRRWAGVRWDDLPQRFPGEVETYLRDPAGIAFGPETLAALAERICRSVKEIVADHPDGATVVVSHQDPIQAARLELTGRPLADLQHDKPGHAEVVSLQGTGSIWSEVGRWSPDAGSSPFPPVTSREDT